MVPDSLVKRAFSAIVHYRMHILVFLFTLLFAFTIAHPVMELNDEWITLNQLNQLHAGHQVIVNEGKYGLWEDGTPSKYFEKKSNLLGYSIALPLISLPSFWLIDQTGDHFPFLVLYLWTFLGLSILIFISVFFKEYSYVGTWRWTNLGFFAIFLIFFINLFFYASFPVSGSETFPEVLAIVFVHCFLIALIAVMIYDICHLIFQDAGFAFFGTVVTISCSSYFFWMTGCKDHILTIFLFTAVLLLMVKFQVSEEYWYLPLAFIFSGLLAWVRPELAFWVFLVLCIYCVIIFYRLWKKKVNRIEILKFACAPFFTLIGAIPFFTNNYMVTNNFFIPAWILWNQDLAAPVDGAIIINENLPSAGITTFHSLSGLLSKMIKIHPDTFFSDLLGVLFFPHNGSMGVFPLVPLFLVMSITIFLLFLLNRIHFTEKEKSNILPLALLAFSVIIAYSIKLNGLNTSGGVLPDIRYLSPMYIPLNILGLLFLQKTQLLTIKPLMSVKVILSYWIIAVPSSLFFIYFLYSELSIRSITPINSTISLTILSLCLMTIILILIQLYYRKTIWVVEYLILQLCALPLLWQIGLVLYIRTFASGAGYTFWIPIIRVLYDVGIFPLLGL